MLIAKAKAIVCPVKAKAETLTIPATIARTVKAPVPAQLVLAMVKLRNKPMPKPPTIPPDILITMSVEALADHTRAWRDYWAAQDQAPSHRPDPGPFNPDHLSDGAYTRGEYGA